MVKKGAFIAAGIFIVLLFLISVGVFMFNDKDKISTDEFEFNELSCLRDIAKINCQNKSESYSIGSGGIEFTFSGKYPKYECHNNLDSKEFNFKESEINSCIN